MNNEHLDEVDEDLIVFASSSGVTSGGEAEPGRLPVAIARLNNPLYGAGRESWKPEIVVKRVEEWR